MPEHSVEKSNARNVQIFSRGYDEYAMRQEEDQNAELMVENSKINDNYFEVTRARGNKSFAVLKPAAITLLDKVDREAKPKSGTLKGWFSKATNSLGISTESREELIDYAIVNTTIPELSNEDIILALPG